MPACSTIPSPEHSSTSKCPKPIVIVSSKPIEPPPFGTNLGRVLRDAHVLVATVNGKTIVFADRG